MIKKYGLMLALLLTFSFGQAVFALNTTSALAATTWENQNRRLDQGRGRRGNRSSGKVIAPGTWTYGTNKNVDGLTNGEITITQNANGKLTGTFHGSDGLNGGMTGNQQGDNVTLNLRPNGWTSDFVVKGRVTSNGGSLAINGWVMHSSNQASIIITPRGR